MTNHPVDILKNFVEMTADQEQELRNVCDKPVCSNCGQYLGERCLDCKWGPVVDFKPIPKWVVSDSLYKIYKHKLSIGEDVYNKPEAAK